MDCAQGQLGDNAVTAIPKLLRLLELTGCIVTLDAEGCQTKIADLILQRGGAYQLAVKENQGQLYQDLNDIAFREDESSVRKDHAPENLAVL